MIYLIFLTLTIVFEFPFYLWQLKKIELAVLYCIIFNFLTHPIAWVAMTTIVGDYYPKLIVIETLVVGTEALLLYFVAGTTKKRALLVSLTANLFTALAGLFISITGILN